MKSIAVVPRVKVSADGHGVVSHAGMGLVRELADPSGLSSLVSVALADTYKGPWVYAPGAVFADLAAAVADGADCIDGVGQLCGDREHVFGAKASTTTMWRLVDQRIDVAHLPRIRAARAGARAAAWAAGAAPAPGEWLHIVTVGQPEDPTHGATLAWPPTRRTIDTGTITIDAVHTEAAGNARDINFDPLILPDGVAPSAQFCRAASTASRYVAQEGADELTDLASSLDIPSFER